MKADRAKITRLLKTARGQIDGILKMIDEDRYCIDVSTQLMACGSVLSRANREVLRSHIEGCIKDAVENGTEQEKLDEVFELLEKLLK